MPPELSTFFGEGAETIVEEVTAGARAALHCQDLGKPQLL